MESQDESKFECCTFSKPVYPCGKFAFPNLGFVPILFFIRAVILAFP